MKKLTWGENPHSRQATKQDLLDIAEALGAPTKALGNQTYSVPALRASIRWWLEKSRAARRQPSLFETLNEQATACPSPEDFPPASPGCLLSGACRLFAPVARCRECSPLSAEQQTEETAVRGALERHAQDLRNRAQSAPAERPTLEQWCESRAKEGS